MDKLKQYNHTDIKILRRIGKSTNTKIYVVGIEEKSYVMKLYFNEVERAKDEVAIHLLLDHPQIPKLIGIIPVMPERERPSGRFPHSGYGILMEDTRGFIDLFDMMGGTGVDEAITRNIIKQVVAALCHMHDKKIFHGDLKPANIIANFRGEAKLIDFSHSYQIGGDGNFGGAVTAPYYPPEFIRAQRGLFNQMFVDHRLLLAVDVWCLGIVTYEILHGEIPFSPHVFCLETDVPVKWMPHVPISQQAKDFILFLLKYNVKERPSIEQVREHEWLA